MAIVRKVGKPDLFITMTCNPNWDEVTQELLPGQKGADRPDATARAFNQKVKVLLSLLNTKQVYGKVIGHIEVVEFQKGGLPHIHMLLCLEEKPKPEDIDKYKLAYLTVHM